MQRKAILETAICPNCWDEEKFEYNGVQEDEEGMFVRDLYTCRRCGSTFTNKTLGIEKR